MSEGTGTALGGGENTGGTGAAPPPKEGGTSAGHTGGTGSWRDTLPEDIRAHGAISSFKDVEALAKSHIHAQSQLGKKGVIAPTDKSTPEEWSDFYRQVGVPAADKYEIALPKDAQIPEAFAKGFKELAIKNNLLPKQANDLIGGYHELSKAQEAARVQSEAANQKKAIEGLRQEWGDAYQQNIDSVRMIIKEKGGEEFMKLMNSTTPIVPGNHPGMLKFMANVAKLLGEDKLREGGVGTGGESPADIQLQLDEIRARGAENGFFSKKHPMHQITMQRFESLAKKLTKGR